MKKIYLGNFLVFIFLMLGVMGISEDLLLTKDSLPLFDILGREQGLYNLSVSSIIQDKYGFLWFGTQGGLSEYDGREMHNYRTDPFTENGLAHNLIQTMFYDEKNHELWIGTYQGVSKYIIHENRFVNYTVDNSNLSNSVIVAIQKIGKDIYLGTLNGLNKLNLDSGEIKNYEAPGDVIRDLMVDSKERLLVGTYEGIYEFNTIQEKFEKMDINLPSDFVMVIKEFEKGILTLGLWDGGIVEYNTNNKTIKNIQFDDNRVYTIYRTNDKTLWIGTWGGGLFAVDKNGEKYSFTGNEKDSTIPHPVVYSLYQDKTGILWIGTNGGGIAKLNPRKSDYLYLSHNDFDNFPAGKMNSILIDSKGYLWLSVYNSGLNRYDTNKNEMIGYNNDNDNKHYLPTSSVIKIYETSDGRLLLATGDGIIEYDYTKDTFNNLNILPKDTIVYSIKESNDKKYLWIGTYSEGVFKYNVENENITQYRYIEHEDSSLTDNLVYDILIDSKNRVWVGTNNGLNMMNPNSKNFIFFKEKNGDKTQLGVDTVQTLFEDSKGKIWIGTNGGGISIYNEDGTFTNITEENGLSSNFINGFLESNSGDIWVSTNNGLSIINQNNYEITILTPDDGIGSWEFNSGTYKDNDGNLYFGSTKGITKIASSFKNKNLPKPNIYITDLELYQKKLDIDYSFYNDMNMTFKPKENTLSFGFAALDFDSPEKTKYFYYLKGFDKDWIYSDERDYVTYSNLPFGEYEFMVYAKTIRGVQSDIAKLKFKIEKPWFRTYTAYLIYFLGLLLVIYSIFKIWEAKIINEKNSELAKINEKLENVNKQLEDLSIKDSLTGVFNRRYFNSMVEDYLKLSKRGRTYISLLMIDLDDFKDINDTYGHLAGDYILKDLAKILKSSLKRSTDYVSRYGGDEFVILLYDTDEREAMMIGKEIENSIKKLKIRKEFTEENVLITSSIGMYSVLPDKNTQKNELIEKADKALYLAKKNGKNQIKNYND